MNSSKTPGAAGVDGRAVPSEPVTSVGVILPAGGKGERMGAERKQMLLLGKRTVLEETVFVFDRHPSVQFIYIAVPADLVVRLSGELPTRGVKKLAAVVAGGRSRQESVAAALAAVPDSVKYVLVHDAVRPFISHEEIEAVIQAVKKHDAAALAISDSSEFQS